MTEKYHTVIIGGGCLGTAAAIALCKRLAKEGTDPGQVCLIDKNRLMSGVSARHSGIVRSANADPAAAVLAKHAAQMWENIGKDWGAALDIERTSAIWIASDTEGARSSWQSLRSKLNKCGTEFVEISQAEAMQRCNGTVRFLNDEMCFYEPGAFQVDPVQARAALLDAVVRTGATILENTKVVGFTRDETGQIKSVLTPGQELNTKYIVNAAGPWSPHLFHELGIMIPIGAEPVAVANWRTTSENIVGMPIIADYVHQAYYRSWGADAIHMHQPRKRDSDSPSNIITQDELAKNGADVTLERHNDQLAASQIDNYEKMIRRRFPEVQSANFESGYQSYFDVTPDLRFILGPDHRASNLIHCLGAGQAFKYTPVFGAMMADYVLGDAGDGLADLGRNFSIARFDGELTPGSKQVQTSQPTSKPNHATAGL